MAASKKTSKAKARVTFKDLKAAKNPKGGTFGWDVSANKGGGVSPGWDLFSGGTKAGGSSGGSPASGGSSGWDLSTNKQT
jgi:hypothetical protein